MLKATHLLALFFFMFFLACEDDDICIEPLSSRFNTSLSAKNSESVFSIENLTVTNITNGQNEEVFNGLASSFKVFLPFNSTQVLYKIEISFKSSDPLQSKAPIIEELTISYTTFDQFVSKACGFKKSFKNLSYSTTGNLTINQSKTEIINETETHLNLQF